MSQIAPARRLELPAVLPSDLDVLDGVARFYGRSDFPSIPFSESVWDFSTLPDLPRYLSPRTLRFDWSREPEARRLLLKEIVACLLNPDHPDVLLNAPARPWRPAALTGLPTVLIQLRSWLAWLERRGIRRLKEVTQADCDAYMLELLKSCTPESAANHVSAIRLPAVYRRAIRNSYAEGFRPWGKRSSWAVAGVKSQRDNKTPWIPDAVFNPLLTGALHLVEEAAPVILPYLRERRDGPWEPLRELLVPVLGSSDGGEAPFAVNEARSLRRLLDTACFIVIAGLVGMRTSEMLELEPGCVSRLEDENGLVRWRLNGKVVKQRGHSGDRESWAVIEPVVRAVRVLEELADIHSEPHLLPRVYRSSGEPTLRLNDYAAWQNGAGRTIGLPTIPDHGASPWRLSARQFRRTIARLLARMPHGTIASKVHFKHISAVVTEGYWGPPNESAKDFLSLVEAEEREAQLDKMIKRFDDWKSGQPLAGGGEEELRGHFAEVDSELRYEGAIRDDRQLRLLLQKGAEALHFGLLSDCHFTDPKRARCLQKRGIVDGDRPIIPACEPSRCRNAVIGPEHVPQWKLPINQITVMLEDRRLPKNERQRLTTERERLRGVIAPYEEKENT